MKKALKIFLLSMIGLFCFSSCEKPVQDDLVDEEKPPVDYLEFFDEKEILDSPEYDGFVYKFEKFQNKDAWKGPTYPLEERFVLTQVPEEELSKLGAEGMALSTLFHPLHSYYFAYTSVWGWFDIMIPNSNLLTELSERPNGAGYLLKVYKNMRVPGIEMDDMDMYSLDINDRCMFSQQGFVALLLSTDVFFSQLSPGGRKILAEIAYEKFAEQLEHPDVYSWYSNMYHLIAASTALLELVDFTDEERKFLTYFINVSGHVDGPEMVPIIELIQSKMNILYDLNMEN